MEQTVKIIEKYQRSLRLKIFPLSVQKYFGSFIVEKYSHKMKNSFLNVFKNLSLSNMLFYSK